MANWTYGNWNNASPANTNDPKQGASDMRTIKLQLEDRLSDMVEGFSSAETDSNLVGFKKAIFRPQDTPDTIVNCVQMYAKDVNNKARMHTLDEDGVEVEMMPYGAIIMWSGLQANIPAGWNLCDGEDGRPDMLDRFVKCVASGAVEPGSTDGAATHTHTGPSHTHTRASHTHIVARSGWGSDLSPPWQSGYLQVDNPGNIGRAANNRVSGAETGGAIDAGGTEATGEASSNPAYFEVAFIINS